MHRIALVALLTFPLAGCATISVAGCVAGDPRLGKVVSDPAGVRSYFAEVGVEGRRIVAALEVAEPTGEAAAKWIRDQLDLVDRMNKCVRRK